MKRLLISTLALATAVSPLIATSASAQDWNHRDRYDRNDRDHDGRWDRHHNRWDDRNHNGYSYNGRWHYGPPPAQYYGRVDYGYHNWRRGERLPAYYRDRYREVDYRAYHLRAPPRGYHYVRGDRGEILLTALATGLIVSAILNN